MTPTRRPGLRYNTPMRRRLARRSRSLATAALLAVLALACSPGAEDPPSATAPSPAATGTASAAASDPAGPVAPEPSDEVAAAPGPAEEEFCAAVDEFGGAFLGTLQDGPPSPERLEEALTVAVAASVRAAEAAPSPELTAYFETGSANLQAVQEAYAEAGYDLTAIDPTTLPRVMDPPSGAVLEDVAAQLEATCPGSALPQSGG